MFMFPREKIRAADGVSGFHAIAYFCLLFWVRQPRSIDFRKNRTLTRDTGDEAFIAVGDRIGEVTGKRRETFDSLYTRRIARREQMDVSIHRHGARSPTAGLYVYGARADK